MFTQAIRITAVILFFIAPIEARAVLVPAGLSPGDPYHLAFVTDGTLDATATGIGPYNDFIQAEAVRNPTLTGTDVGVDWFVIGSTVSVNARDNAVIGANVPVFLLDGTTKIADGFSDMWDATIDSPIDIDQFGSDVSGTVVVYTGSDPNGFIKNVSNTPRYLGAVQLVGTGLTNRMDFGWISDGGAGAPNTPQPFYALSEQLTVAVPEPSALACCGLSLVILAAGRLLERRGKLRAESREQRAESREQRAESHRAIEP